MILSGFFRMGPSTDERKVRWPQNVIKVGEERAKFIYEDGTVEGDLQTALFWVRLASLGFIGNDIHSMQEWMDLNIPEDFDWEDDNSPYPELYERVNRMSRNEILDILKSDFGYKITDDEYDEPLKFNKDE